MKSLNFLPEIEHRAVQLELRSLLWNRLALAALAIIASISVLVWVNQWSLEKYDTNVKKKVLEAQAGQASKETASYEAQIREFNTKVKTVTTFSAARISWSNRSAELLRRIPDTVSVESLIFNWKDKSFNLRATARDRDAYTALKDTLVELGWFTRVDPPITDLLARESIKFTLTTAFADTFRSAKP